MEGQKKPIFKSLLLINNRTDMRYSFTSINTFGLSWEYVHDEGLVVIKQNMNEEGNKWEAMAHLKDFSIIKFSKEK